MIIRQAGTVRFLGMIRIFTGKTQYLMEIKIIIVLLRLAARTTPSKFPQLPLPPIESPVST